MLPKRNFSHLNKAGTVKMMTSLSPRQIDILNLARKDGCVSVDQLAANFGLTPQSFLKDRNDFF